MPDASPRSRLTSEQDFSPWIRAQSDVPGCALFWLPISGFPLTHQELTWLDSFVAQFTTVLAGERYGLRAELFLEYGQAAPALAGKIRAYLKGRTLSFGLGRTSDEDLPPEPTPEDADSAQAARKPDAAYSTSAEAQLHAASPGKYLLWLVNKEAERQRELFAGHGILTTIFLAQDDQTRPIDLRFTPALRAALPAFQLHDIDTVMEAKFAMRDGFLRKSIKLFGKGLEAWPERWFDSPKLDFILPLPESSNVFGATDELRSRWFSLFDIYLHESRSDGGMLLAIKGARQELYEAALLQVLAALRNAGISYEARR